MPKFRLLSTEELSELEKIFINFLAANSITYKDWEKIKAEDIKKMNSLIEEFSDVVFEKTISNIRFLEKRSQRKMLVYKIEESKILLEGIEFEGESSFDFRNEFDISELNNLFQDESLKVSFIEGNKPYFEEKNIEIFELMESGAMISQNEILFDILNKLKNKYS